MSFPAFTSLSEVAAHLGAVGPDKSGNYTVFGLAVSGSTMQSQVDHANKYLSSIVPGLTGPGSTDLREVSAELASVDLACLGILVTSVGGAMVGAYDYFLGDMRVARSTPYASAIKIAIDGYRQSLISNLQNVSTVAMSAEASAAQCVPRYNGGLLI
jgi:hypothetical protein